MRQTILYSDQVKLSRGYNSYSKQIVNASIPNREAPKYFKCNGSEMRHRLQWGHDSHLPQSRNSDRKAVRKQWTESVGEADRCRISTQLLKQYIPPRSQTALRLGSQGSSKTCPKVSLLIITQNQQHERLKKVTNNGSFKACSKVTKSKKNLKGK